MFGLQAQLQHHERTILEAVIAAAPDQVRPTLRAQVDQIRYVQRIGREPEVNFYARRRKAGGWDPRWLFPKRDELCIAHVSLLVDGKQYESSLHVVQGTIFALTTRPHMRSTRRSQIQVTGVRTESWGRLLDPEGDGDARDLTPPSFRQYQQTGPRMGKSGWNVLETQDLYVVALAEGDAVVLAAGPDGRMLLGWVADGRERFSVVHPEEDDVRVLTATSFPAALEEAAS